MTKKTRDLPRGMHMKHGAYYLVRKNKWHHLSRDRQEAFAAYARMTGGPNNGALADLIEITLNFLETKKKRAANTIAGYTRVSRHILAAFTQFSPDQIEPHNIAEYLDDMADTPSQANLNLAFLRNLFERGIRKGYVKADPTRDIKKFETKGRNRYITPAEYARIHEAADPIMRCAMDLAYITGQRIGDVRTLRRAHVSSAGLTVEAAQEVEVGVRVEQQKTHHRVLVEMTPDLRRALDNALALSAGQTVQGLYLFQRRNGEPITYTMMNKRWLKATRAAGVENVKFHDIRAAAATDSKAGGRDSKALLGHTTEASHNGYLRSREVTKATPNPSRVAAKS